MKFLSVDEPVTVSSGIGPKYGERLEAAGVSMVGDLATADAERLEAETDLSVTRIGRWVEPAEDHLAA